MKLIDLKEHLSTLFTFIFVAIVCVALSIGIPLFNDAARAMCRNILVVLATIIGKLIFPE